VFLCNFREVHDYYTIHLLVLFFVKADSGQENKIHFSDCPNGGYLCDVPTLYMFILGVHVEHASLCHLREKASAAERLRPQNIVGLKGMSNVSPTIPAFRPTAQIAGC